MKESLPNQILVDLIDNLATLCWYLPETHDYLTEVNDPERSLEILTGETLPPTDEELIQMLREELNKVDEGVGDRFVKDLPKELQKLEEIEMSPPDNEEEIREEWLEQMAKIMNPVLMALADFDLYI